MEWRQFTEAVGTSEIKCVRMCHVDRVTQNLKDLDIDVLQLLNAHAPGKQRCLRLKPAFSHDKTKWFRWVTWGMLPYTVTDSSTYVMLFFHSDWLGRVWFPTLSYIQGKFDFFPWLVSLFTVIPTELTHVGPLCHNWNLPFLSFSLSLSRSLSFSSSRKPCLLQDHCISGKFCIATEQNNYIFIYVQWKWMHTSSWNKHSERLH